MIVQSRLAAAANGRARLKLRGFPLERSFKAEMIEDRRLQVRRDTLNRRNRELDETRKRPQLVAQRQNWTGVGSTHLLAQPREVQFRARQDLTEFVVQLARKTRTLFFARAFQSARQAAQPIRFRAGSFGTQEIIDIQ